MRVNQTVSQIQPQSVSRPQKQYPAKPQELPMSVANRLFPLHQLDDFLSFIFQLLLVFIISASVFPALRWLDTQMQQFSSSTLTK
jgi:hypothetical protein